MDIKYIKIVYLFLMMILVLQGCAGIKKRQNQESVSGVVSPHERSEEKAELSDGGYDEEKSQTEAKPEFKTTPASPKIALVLGPGGVRTYAHIAVLQELQKQKVNIVSVSGFEFASLPAAIFASKGLAYEVEWQMFKLKDEEIMQKSLLGESKPVDIAGLAPYLKSTFVDSSVDKSKIKFSCPAYNYEKNQTLIMSKGNYEALLPYCIPMPPLFSPHHSNVAGTNDLKTFVDYLRLQGANYVVYVDVASDQNKELGVKTSLESRLLWKYYIESINKQLGLVDYVIKVDMSEFSMGDFSKRRSVFDKSKELAPMRVDALLKKLNL